MLKPGVILVIGIIFLIMAIYIYRYLLRIAEVLGFKRKNKWVHIVVILISAALLYIVTQFIGYGLVILAHILVIAWILDGIHFLVKKIHKGYREDSRLNMLYKSGVIPILLTVLILTYGFFQMRNVVETDYEVFTDKTIRQEGYTIAMISDLHYPTTMNKEALEEYCQEINSKNPDFVVLCGDIVDESTSKEEMKEALRILGQLQNQYGIYYVYGNHDCAVYSNTPDFTKGDLNWEMASNNITILEDSVATVNKEIAILGREDRGYGNADTRADQEKLLAKVEAELFLLLLDHQPKELKENADLGIDLQLSGHTHAGQLWPAGLIGEWMGANEQNYGLREDNGFTSIVSSGIAGWGNSLRTAKHSEYVIIELKPED